ncbi:hypothetical protein Poli38472_006299 [Pythium oligandrum]|uniref:tRNA (guanine(9)-N(1))-methyltransferase n=1 Tax=Pythium oligandrum TaxID=41045 RepID=A0A8K1CUE3_PYTOL|nr:hypothetical protein Poli38472_006299 [Pythium oligandrum]|eukprot:TMW68831.1 hypothetical protein Poli38472_006299 [Pythium oligandrum]
MEATEAKDGTLSRRAERRAKRREHWDNKKEKKKQQRRLEKEEKRQNQPVVELDMSEEAVLRRRERAIAKRESYLMASEEGLQIVIDCGFEEAMSEKEKKSLSQQIMFSYGVNRRSAAPLRATITSLRGDTKDNLTKISGFNEWLAFKSTELSYMELFRKEALVYLTADSPNTITELDKDKVYIIGGIVDRNRLKGATYNKALEQGIATAKLPLDQHVDMGASTRVLTVNHVFEILVRYSETKDWKGAAMSTLPSRKGVEEKQE